MHESFDTEEYQAWEMLLKILNKDRLGFHPDDIIYLNDVLRLEAFPVMAMRLVTNVSVSIICSTFWKVGASFTALSLSHACCVYCSIDFSRHHALVLQCRVHAPHGKITYFSTPTVCQWNIKPPKHGSFSVYMNIHSVVPIEVLNSYVLHINLQPLISIALSKLNLNSCFSLDCSGVCPGVQPFPLVSLL